MKSQLIYELLEIKFNLIHHILFLGEKRFMPTKPFIFAQTYNNGYQYQQKYIIFQLQILKNKKGRMYVTKQIQNNFNKKKNSTHQRSVLRQMMSTCDKLQNSWLTKEQTKKYQVLEKIENEQSKKFKRQSRFSNSNSLPRFSHQLPKCGQKIEQLIFVKESKQMKQIKDLNQRMTPKVNKTNIDKKFKELAFLKNMGYKNHGKRLDCFKAPDFLQRDQKRIVQKSWQKLKQDKLSKTVQASQASSKKTSYYFSNGRLNHTAGESSFFNANKYFKPNNFNSSLQSTTMTSEFQKSSPQTQNHSLMDFDGIQTFKQSRINDRNLQNSNGLFQVHQRIKGNEDVFSKLKKLTKISNNKKKSLNLQNKIKKQLKSNSQKISIHQQSTLNTGTKRAMQQIGLNKQKIQKQNAHKLYSLIKGGYNIDDAQVQGQYISLNRFREAKQNFDMLKNCFNQVRQYRYVIKNPQQEFNNKDFRSLVFLSEVQNKIPPSLYRKILEMNKVVL